MENNTFNYEYSATQNREVEQIRERYLPREQSKMQTLKKLDSKVRRAGMIESLILGVIGCLVFGIGMCFGLDVFAGADWLTVSFCLAYPMYNIVLKHEREKIAPEIIMLTDELMQ